MKKTLVTVSLALAISSQTAMADSGFYLGAGLGKSKLDVPAEFQQGLNWDDSDTAWKLMGGYQFHENAAVEFTYYDLGTYSASNGPVSASVDVTALSLALVGNYPVADNFSILGRLGWVEADGDYSDPSVADEDETDFIYGLGLGYAPAQNINVRLEWERMNLEDEVDLISLSGTYRF